MLTSADTRERSPGGRAVLLVRCLLRNNTTEDKVKYKDKNKDKDKNKKSPRGRVVLLACAKLLRNNKPVSLIFEHTQAIDFVTLV